MFLVAGWYDIFNRPQLDDWWLIQAQGQPQVLAATKIVIGPWNHTFVNRHQGYYSRGRPAAATEPLGLMRELKEWLDYALKGEANGWDRRAPVRLYVMGEKWTMAFWMVHSQDAGPLAEVPDSLVVAPGRCVPAPRFLARRTLNFGP